MVLYRTCIKLSLEMTRKTEVRRILRFCVQDKTCILLRYLISDICMSDMIGNQELYNIIKLQLKFMLKWSDIFTRFINNLLLA